MGTIWSFISGHAQPGINDRKHRSQNSAPVQPPRLNSKRWWDKKLMERFTADVGARLLPFHVFWSVRHWSSFMAVMVRVTVHYDGLDNYFPGMTYTATKDLYWLTPPVKDLMKTGEYLLFFASLSSSVKLQYTPGKNKIKRSFKVARLKYLSAFKLDALQVGTKCERLRRIRECGRNPSVIHCDRELYFNNGLERKWS